MRSYEAATERPGGALTQFRDMARLAAEGGEGHHDEDERLEAQLKRLDREEGRLIDAYQAGVISLEELDQRRRRIGEQRLVLSEHRKQQEKLSRASAHAREVLTDLTAFCDRVRSRLDEASFEEKQ